MLAIISHLVEQSSNAELVDVKTRDVAIVKYHRVPELMPRGPLEYIFPLKTETINYTP